MFSSTQHLCFVSGRSRVKISVRTAAVVLQWSQFQSKSSRNFAVTDFEKLIQRTFIVAPWNVESIFCSLTNKCTFYWTWKSLNLHENTRNCRSYMFRSSTILRKLVQSLAKVTLLLKHSVKLRRCILCGYVAAWYLRIFLNLCLQNSSFIKIWQE